MKEPEYFQITSSTVTKQTLADAEPALINHIDADIIILPSRPEHRAFFEGTLDVRDYIRDHGGSVDIWTSDETYKVVALHSAAEWIGTFLVQLMALPMALNVLSNYIFQWLQAKDDDTLEIHLIVERKDGTSTSIEFRGPAKDFSKVVEAAKALSHE